MSKEIKNQVFLHVYLVECNANRFYRQIDLLSYCKTRIADDAGSRKDACMSLLCLFSTSSVIEPRMTFVFNQQFPLLLYLNRRVLLKALIVENYYTIHNHESFTHISYSPTGLANGNSGSYKEKTHSLHSLNLKQSMYLTF